MPPLPIPMTDRARIARVCQATGAKVPDPKSVVLSERDGTHTLTMMLEGSDADARGLADGLRAHYLNIRPTDLDMTTQEEVRTPMEVTRL